jgi:uncharacterized protein (TIGR00251 family)
VTFATLSVRVVPRSSREGVAGFEGGVVRIRLNAPPVEGRANEALLKFLAKSLGVSRARVALVSGETGRNKIVRIAGITRTEALDALGLRPPPGQAAGAGEARRAPRRGAG